MLKLHLPVRADKLPHLIRGRIGPRTETCINWSLPITMVPCFHQRNIYIQRKLRIWREQKCIPLVDGETQLTCADRQTTPSHRGRYRAENKNLHKLWRTYRHGTVFAPRQYLYLKEATGMELESPKMYFTCRCRNPTYMYEPINYPDPRGAI